MNVIITEIKDILKEEWISPAHYRDRSMNIVIQACVAIIITLVLFWDFYQLNSTITPVYIVVKGLTIASFVVGALGSYYNYHVNFWPVVQFPLMIFYSYFGMTQVHFTYCYSFWEVYLAISIFFKYSRKTYILLMLFGLYVNFYAIHLSAEPDFVKEGMSFKPHMIIVTILVFVLSMIAYFVVTKKRQQIYEMQERFANIGKQSSYVFHEIKKPINRLISASTIEDQELKKINNIILNVELMMNNSEVFTQSFTLVDIKKIFHELESQYMIYFDNFNIHYEFEDLDTKKILANEQLIYQVFNNLTINAVEAISTSQSASSFIKITSRNVGKKLEVSFKNTGSSIPGDLQYKIFNPFVSTKCKEANSGLGLSFCKNIIDGHSGEIRLINHKDGPEFIVTI